MADLVSTSSPGTPLPSQTSAARLVAGDVTALPSVALHVVGRAALIGVGMAIFGQRDPKVLVGGSLAGSGMIELFVLIHELTNQHR